VDIYQSAYLVDVNATVLDFDLTRRIEISDAELAWIVAQAKAAGLEVHEYMLIAGEDVNHVLLPTPPTRAWAGAYLDAYTRFIVNRAVVAQSDGIQALQLDWGVYWFDWTPLRDLFIAKMTAAAQQVRGVYSGKILYGATAPWLSNDVGLMTSIDWFIGDLFSNIQFSAAENANITVPQLKQKYLDLMTGGGSSCSRIATICSMGGSRTGSACRTAPRTRCARTFRYRQSRTRLCSKPSRRRRYSQPSA